MSKADGTPDSSMTFYPFGATGTGSVNTTKKFTGQRLDSTGLYYYNARYYDPLIGRFTSPDTEGVSLANPQSLNRYSYCLNNPLNRTDPTGHWSWKSFFKTVVKVVVAVAAVAIVASTVAAAVITANPQIAAAAVGECVSTAIYIGKSLKNKQDITSAGLLGAVVSGGVSGAVSSLGVGLGTLASGGIGNTLGTIAGDITEKLTCKATGENNRSNLNSDLSPRKLETSIICGAASGIVGEGLNAGINGIRVACKDGVDAVINQSFYYFNYGYDPFFDGWWLAGSVTGLSGVAAQDTLDQKTEK